MSYEEVPIEDMTWNAELKAYTYECPCGDLFQITLEDLKKGEDRGDCPSCSLYITVLYDPEDFADDEDDDDDLDPQLDSIEKLPTEIVDALDKRCLSLQRASLTDDTAADAVSASAETTSADA